MDAIFKSKKNAQTKKMVLSQEPKKPMKGLEPEGTVVWTSRLALIGFSKAGDIFLILFRLPGLAI
jgi:hypothetical protein